MFESADLKQTMQACFIDFKVDPAVDPETPTRFDVTATLTAGAPLPGLAEDGTITGSSLLGLFSPTTPIFVGDTELDERLTERLRSDLRARGIRSLIVYPLRARAASTNQLFGLMAAYFEKPNIWQAADHQHIDFILDQVAAALENAQLLAQERRARAEAEEANTIRLQFLAMISHELRTPLTSIKGFASTLLASDVTWNGQQQTEFIGIIDEEANKLTELIDQLLDMSRLQAGALSIHLEPRRLPDVLATMKPQLYRITQQHRLIIEEGDELPFVQVDPKRLSQIFINLVGNAAKFSPPGTPIVIAFMPVLSQVQVNVIDEGPGVMPEDRERSLPRSPNGIVLLSR